MTALDILGNWPAAYLLFPFASELECIPGLSQEVFYGVQKAVSSCSETLYVVSSEVCCIAVVVKQHAVALAAI